MSVATKPWQKCGNTPYFRQGADFIWDFCDPFNWREVTTSSGPLGAAQVIMVARYVTPGYDWELLKEGVPYIADDKATQQEILKFTHEWFHDLTSAKSQKQTPKEIMALFKEGPAEAQAFVLKGVGALIQGYLIEERKQTYEKKPIDTNITIAIAAGPGLALEKVREIESHFEDLSKTLIADAPEDALEMALSSVGIFEC